jgi:uncharacterized membrane protein
MKKIIVFLITFVIFMIIDLVWLGILMWPVYERYLGVFLRTPPNWPVAVLFYVLFIIGMMIFAINDALEKKSVKLASYKGALFGFFTYMTYELTNWAVIANWPAGIVPIDILWGTVLSASVCGISTWICLKINLV